MLKIKFKIKLEKQSLFQECIVSKNYNKELVHMLKKSLIKS